MKKSLSLLFFVLLILPFLSAVEFEMKSNFSQDESLLAQVSGNFLEQIQEQNVLMYKEHVRVPFLPTVEESQDRFYIFGQLFGKSPGNYSLIIRDVSYFESGESKNNDLIKNFTITEEQADFFIGSGFLQTTGSFQVNAENLADKTIAVDSFILNEGKTKTQITPGKAKLISFSAGNSYNNELIYAILETNNTRYAVPVYVSNNTSQEEPKSSFEFQPDERDVSLASNSSTFIYLYLHNSGEENLTDISISVSDSINKYVSVSEEISLLPANSSVQIKANISSEDLDGFIEGGITAETGNLSAEFTLLLNFSKAFVSDNGSLFQTCAEKGGSFCNENQTCGGQVKNAEDGACCIGGCRAISTNSGKIFGWVLVAIIVLLGLAFFVLRYIKAKKPFNLLDFARKKP